MNQPTITDRYRIVTNLGGAALIGAMLISSPVSRRWYKQWGATVDEDRRTMPGDDLVPQPRLASTRAVTIRAPAESVWPWLAQIGQGRGGLYSYDGLENLAGCQIHSADHILPEFQQLQIDDKIRLGPEGYPFFIVASIEPGAALVLKSGVSAQDPNTASSWAFVLTERDPNTTRLIVRQRLAYPSSLVNQLLWRVFTDPISFVMERKTLLGIKARAEAVSRQASH